MFLMTNTQKSPMETIMKNLLTFMAATILSATSLSPIYAQQEFVDTYNARHLKRKPLVGEIPKPVQVFDSQGKKFSTDSLRGKHSVVVFGCLT